MSASEFQALAAQLVALYERDVAAARQDAEAAWEELGQLSEASKENPSGARAAKAPSPTLFGPQFGARLQPDILEDEHPCSIDLIEAPEPPEPPAVLDPAKSAVDVVASVRSIVSQLEQLEAENALSLPRTIRSKSRLDNLRIQAVEKPYLETMVVDPLEHVSGGVICLNVLFTLVQLQVRGFHLQSILRTNTAPAPGDDLREEAVFFILEHVFNAFFLAELILRISILHGHFLRSRSSRSIQWFNLFDFFIVMFSSFDLYLSTFATQGQGGTNLLFARVLRLARLSRTLKVIQVLRSFSRLRILLKTVAASVLSFTWSMVILAVLNIGAAIFLCQMLQPSIADDTLDIDIRLDLFRMYGTSARSVWTMFEFTFSGGWPAYARPIIENVHWSYSLFFAAYVSIVVFAVIRIITALFIKETLNVAARDADFMVQESMKAKREYARKLTELFELADSSGNGTIDIDEFKAICQIPEVIHYFNILELEISEVQALFDMLDDGDGQVTYDEFVSGIVRLKGTARSMDVLTMMQNCELINDRCKRLEDLLSSASQTSEGPGHKK